MFGNGDTNGHGVINSLTAQIAVLAEDGTIIAVNRAWESAEREAGGAEGDGSAAGTGVGANYLAVCRRAKGEEADEARATADGIEAVLRRSLPRFDAEYPCHSPAGEERWFLMCATPFEGMCNGAVVAHFNISERKASEEALQRSEAKCRALVEEASDGIHTYDLGGNIIEVNSKLCEILGYTREELLRLNVSDLVFPADLQAAPIRFEELRAGRTLMTERRLRRKDGSSIDAEISGKMLPDGTLQSIIRDVTKRKLAEEALLESSEFNRQIIKSAREGIVVYDGELKYTLWNPYMEELTGLPASEVLGRRPLDLFPFLREHDVGALLERALAGETVSTPDMRYEVAETGRAGWASAKYSPLYDAKGETVGGLGMIHDVTERRRTQEALRESEQRLSLHAQQSVLAFVEWNLDGEVTEWNPAAEDIFGYTREEALSRRADDFIVSDEVRDYVAQLWGEMLARKAGTRGINENVTKDGRVIFCDWYNTPLVGADGRVMGVVSLAQDITERKRAEDALLASEERFFKAFNASPVAMSINRFDDGRYLDVNDGFLKSTGYAREEVLGRDPSALGIWADPQDAARLARTLEREARVENFEINFRTKSGEVRAGVFAAETIEIGGERCVLSLTNDVTESKRAARRLSAQYEITRALAENATPDETAPRILRAICECLGWAVGVFWRVDRGAGVLRCVEVWRAADVEAAEFVEVSRAAAYPPRTGFPSHVWAERRPLWVPDIARDARFPRAPVAARTGLHGAFGFPVMLGDEILGVMEFFSFEIRQPDDDLLGMVSTVGSQIGQFLARKRVEEALSHTLDELEGRVLARTAELAEANRVLQAEIVERVRTEDALRQSEQFSKRIIESSLDCIKVMSLDGHLLYVNPGGQKLLEICDVTAYLGNPWLDFYDGPTLARAEEAFATARAGGVGTFQGYCPTESGTPRWWDVVVTPVTDGAGRVARLMSISRDVTERHSAEETRVEWTRRLVTAQEDERRRIARELHDQTGQHLTVLMLGLDSLKKKTALSERSEQEVVRLSGTIQLLGRELHRLAWELRPADLDELGLKAALAHYVEEWSGRTGVAADYHADGLGDERLAPQAETTVYRVVQEALTNVARHAAASRVSLILERRPDHVLTIVEDNGGGFDAEAVVNVPVAERRLGLLGMQERAALVGGSLEIESAPGAGTTLFLRVPARAAAGEDADV